MSPILQLALLALMIAGGVVLIAGALVYVLYRQNNGPARPLHGCNTGAAGRSACVTEPATVSRDIRSKNMLSISERTNLVNTVDTLSQLEGGGESAVNLLARLRATHPSARWRILYLEQLGGTDNTRPAQVQAMVELTIRSLPRKNIGESTVEGNGDPFLTAIVNALVPMLLVELADIEEAEALTLADRERFM